MELGFKGDAGPLNQIGVQLFSIDTAVHLATGASGWWAAKRTARSLQQVLLPRNASLGTVTSFNFPECQKRLSGFTLYGAARQPGGRFSSIRLPKASTSVSQDAGMCCLRAVTSALLCFLDEATTTDILMAVLSANMIHYDQDGVVFEVLCIWLPTNTWKQWPMRKALVARENLCSGTLIPRVSVFLAPREPTKRPARALISMELSRRWRGSLSLPRNATPTSTQLGVFSCGPLPYYIRLGL